MAAKCFIGYGEAMSHVEMNKFKGFKHGSKTVAGLLNDYNPQTGQLFYIVRFHKKEGNNDIFYLPNKQVLKDSEKLGDGNFISGCRESIRGMYTKLHSMSKTKSYEEYNNKIAIGFKFQYKNKQQLNIRMKRAIKLFNAIEEQFEWEDRTTLHKADKNNILFVNEDEGIEDLASTDQLMNDPKFKEYITLSTVYYLFKPAPEWLRSSHTMSLFMLFMRLCANNKYGNINSYQDLKNQTEKNLSPYKGCIYCFGLGAFLNIATGSPVGQKSKDDIYLYMTYHHMDTLLKNIRKIFDNISISYTDSMVGVGRLINSTYKYIGEDRSKFVKNFREMITKEIGGSQ